MTPLDHLRAADPILGAVIDRIGPLEIQTERPDNHFEALCRIIVGQQLSTTVARTIWNRVSGHFGENILPAAVLETEIETLRGLGLSGQKARYLQSLATHVQDGLLDVDHLETLSDEDVTAQIVAVKGLGSWSADMFAMFHLNRPDILPVGDLGIRVGMQKLYGLENRPTPEEMYKIAEPWRPYRTLASRYLWRSLDNE